MAELVGANGPSQSPYGCSATWLVILPGSPVSDAELTSQKIAGSQLAVIEDAAHLPDIEQSMDFNEILDDFLKQQSARSQQMGLAGD